MGGFHIKKYGGARQKLWKTPYRRYQDPVFGRGLNFLK